MILPKDFIRDTRQPEKHFNNERIKLGYQNYCKVGVMAKCTAGVSWKEQCLCKFSKKSAIGDRCMHYRENIDGHCDCVSAQREKPERR
jgi:hypothetical protein